MSLNLVPSPATELLPVAGLPVAAVASPAGKNTLHALTGLRFFAAFAVVLFHYSNDATAGAPVWLRNLLSSGFLAVNLFFILSGFILAYNYLAPDGQLNVSRKEFYRARFARIYPVYFFGLLLYAPFLILVYLRDYPLRLMLLKLGLVAPSTLALVQAWFPTAAMEWNGPSWSLSVEAFFYALFPFLAPLADRLGRMRPLTTLGSLWTLSLVPPAVFLALDPHHGSWPWGAHEDACVWSFVVPFNPLFRLPAFLAGVVLCKIYLSGRVRIRGSVLAGAGAASALVILVVRGKLPSVLAGNGLLDPLLGLVVIGLAVGGGLLHRFLAQPAIELLGEASYSLYILHVPIWLWVSSVNEKFFAFRTSSAPFFLAYCVIVVGFSIVSLRLVEIPYRQAIRAARQKRRPPKLAFTDA
jgi:peptidoglycan/LPS O-acetylase OafA/YrhL